MCLASRSRFAQTATSCGSPYETEKVSTRKSSASRPTTETGSLGSFADSATARAKGMFFSNSAWISDSSSGKSKPNAAVLFGHPLVVGDRVRRGLARRHLGREAEGSVLLLHVRVGVAVRRVQLGRDVGVVAGDGGVRVVADHRLVDHVVRRRRGDLPADAVQQQFGRRVVVHQELRGDVGEQLVERLRLGFGCRRGTAVRVARRVGRRALVVVAPPGRVIAVQVDAVAVVTSPSPSLSRRFLRQRR